MDIKILENLLRETIDQGNLTDSHQQVIQKWMRGIYFIDPEDKEFKETIKNARKKLETLIAPANKNCGNGASNKVRTRLACILEADESTRLRMGNSLPNHHKDHIAGKGSITLWFLNLFLCLEL